MSNSIKQLVYALLLFSFGITTSIKAREYIELFESSIQVESSGMLDIRERIIVHSEQYLIRHGIFREIPLIYTNHYGFFKRNAYELLETTLDGQKVAVFTRYARNGVVFVIGNPNTFIQAGRHEFVVHYRLSHELGFFDTHDELYFNITGNGWRLPIAQTRAIVQLPYDGPENRINLAVYTGFLGAKEHDAVWKIGSSNGKKNIVFETTQPLAAYQGLTIVVGWPKGYVVLPTVYSIVMRFVRDNISIFILLICLLLSICLGVFFILRRRRSAPRGTIYPLFEPPAGYSPGACAYILKRNYSARSFAADVVGIAVEGGIEIESIKNFLGRASYRLTKKERSKKEFSFDAYNKIVDGLFAYSDSIELKRNKENSVLTKTGELLYIHYDRILGSFVKFNVLGFLFITALSCVGFVISYFIDPFLFSSFITYVILIVLVCAILIIGFFNRWYTPEGRLIADKIEGFKMYLETAESERLKVIGTPPDRTPELYETFLPYAMALGVEKQWTKQFEPVFELYKRMHHTPYYPVWFVGDDLLGFSHGTFASSFVSSIGSSTITSASFAPGSSSGFSSGGSSGGGGGGGGGGGW